tara:strand:+ start:807 stop:1214 length:408 start_codon:yes stop_codon:yes gene_type:complete
MSLVDHARKELEIAGFFDKDSDYGGMLGEAVMKMVELFAEEGHSGYSAGMAISLFKTVASYDPLTPLTGSDDEWVEIADNKYQNNRCSHVFKDGNQAYDIDAVIFREKDGGTFTSRDSRRDVEFPYVPKREYVDV